MNQTSDTSPWYKRTLRWGQTNLTEIDPQRYDQELWSQQWEDTAVQGVIINAGGIIAYYPSEIPLHFRSPYLGERDLFGEINAAARNANLTVLARMDCNRAEARLFHEHPDWFCIDESGNPYQAAGRYVSCVNSPFYEDFIPSILQEIIERYEPDGFADNSWSGLPRTSICYCAYCRRAFARRSGEQIPRGHDLENPVYREWIRWNYDRRLEIWDYFNEVTTQAGGPDCLWIGMNSSIPEHQSANFRDTQRIIERAPFVLMDQQFRREHVGFQENAYSGKLMHGIKDWNGLATESMAMYNYSKPPFRTASAPAPEAQMWMVSGFAGSILPWWHHIGAVHQDRRQYATAPPVTRWHKKAQHYLIRRRPVANIGVVWSQQNLDFYGKGDPAVVTQLPLHGVINALIREKLPYVPVHIDQVGSHLQGIDVLVLPSIGSMSEQQCERVRDFVAAGGGLVATGETSLYDEDGQIREDFGLGEVLGVEAKHRHLGATRHAETSWETAPTHTYLDVVDPAAQEATRHAVLAGFEGTQQLPFGGRVECVQPVDAQPLLTFIPPYPSYPPETSWQRHEASSVPGLVVRENVGRVAYFPADIDRCFGRGNQPDHARLLTNAILWAAQDRRPLRVKGTGTLDTHLYRHEDGALVLHLVNLSAAGAWKAPMHEQIPVGPFTVTVDPSAAAVNLATDMGSGNTASSDGNPRPEAQLLVSGDSVETILNDHGLVQFEVPRINHHEVVVIF